MSKHEKRYIVQCSCGRAWSLETFRELPFVGRMTFDEAPEALEMYNCTCGSTRGVWTDNAGNPYAEHLKVANEAAIDLATREAKQ